MTQTGPHRALRRLLWLVPIVLIAVVATLATRDVPLLGAPSPLEQVREGVHPRVPPRLVDDGLRFGGSGAAAVVVIEPGRCDEVCRGQRRAVRALARTTLRDGLVLRISGSSGLSAWLGTDEPMVLAITRDGRLAIAIHRAANLKQLRSAVREARSHPSGIPASWPR